jgi:hypothetical protein
MHGLFMIAESGDAYVAWHAVESAAKDGGKALRKWIDEWVSLPENREPASTSAVK